MRQLLLCVLLVCGVAAAQSFFNPRGLGEAALPDDAALLAQGGPVALSFANPGSFVRLDRATLRFGGLFSSAIGSQAGNARGIIGVRPTGLDAAVPVPAGFRVLAGVSERFNQDFDVWSDSLADTLYRRHIIGRGGIYALRAGLAKSFADAFALGVEYNYLIGGSRENWEYEVAGVYSSTDTVEADYRAGSLRAGLGLALGPVSGGAWFEPALALTARRLRKVHGVVADSDRTYLIDLPWSGGAAVQVRPAERFGLSLGATYQPWSAASIADDDSTRSLGFRDALRLSAGAEFLVAPEHPVRAGYSYATWYYANSAGEAIVEHGIHAGTGFAIPKFGTIDVVAEILLRDTPGLRETAGRLGLTLAYGEVWGKRTRRWGY
jgi:hypothetical protein